MGALEVALEEGLSFNSPIPQQTKGLEELTEEKELVEELKECLFRLVLHFLHTSRSCTNWSESAYCYCGIAAVTVAVIFSCGTTRGQPPRGIRGFPPVPSIPPIPSVQGELETDRTGRSMRSHKTLVPSIPPIPPPSSSQNGEFRGIEGNEGMPPPHCRDLATPQAMLATCCASSSARRATPAATRGAAWRSKSAPPNAPSAQTQLESSWRPGPLSSGRSAMRRVTSSG